MRYQSIVTSCFLLLGLSGDAIADTIKVLELENLAGQLQSWPSDLVVPKTVVIVGFERSHQTDVENWIEALGLPNDGAYAQVLVLGRGAALVRGIIDGGLKKAFDDAQEARTFTVYQSADSFSDAFHITDRSIINVLVVDREGRILAHESGPPSQSAAAKIKQSM
jgi:hypothetical protein